MQDLEPNARPLLSPMLSRQDAQITRLEGGSASRRKLMMLANIDIRSFSINYEINAVLYNERLAKELEQDFERDLAYCTEFDAAEYRERNAAVRFRDSVARVLSPVL